ncbi:MAG: hypothetical protein IJS14_11000 [Lentisphaeria bacterium]|nr:hypothetical protein [Lentisphaeria bacterium]
MTGKIMLAAAVSLILTAAWSADPSANVPVDKLAAAKDSPKQEPEQKQKPAAKEKKTDPEEEAAKIRELENQRRALFRRLQQKRIDLLKNNPKLNKMYLDILRQTQELAIELDSDMEIRALNNELREVEKQLNEKRK